jgi:hypothetical protein
MVRYHHHIEASKNRFLRLAIEQETEGCVETLVRTMLAASQSFARRLGHRDVVGHVFVIANHPLSPSSFSDRARHVRILKGISTEPTITIEGKYINAVPMANRLHIMMATNDDWAVDASLEARRYVVLDVNESRINDFAYFKAIQDELDHGGLEAMLYDPSHLPLVRFDAFNVRRVPKTSGLDEQKKQSFTVPDQWLQEILARGYVWGPQYGCTMYFREWHETVTTALFFKSYELFAQQHQDRRPLNRITIGKFLTSRGFKLVEKIPHQDCVIDEQRSEFGTSAHPILHNGRTSGYQMGSLEEARNKFEATLRLKIEWPPKDTDEF